MGVFFIGPSARAGGLGFPAGLWSVGRVLGGLKSGKMISIDDCLCHDSAAEGGRGRTGPTVVRARVLMATYRAVTFDELRFSTS